jgi:hypothetical protein
MMAGNCELNITCKEAVVIYFKGYYNIRLERLNEATSQSEKPSVERESMPRPSEYEVHCYPSRSLRLFVISRAKSPINQNSFSLNPNSASMPRALFYRSFLNRLPSSDIVNLEGQKDSGFEDRKQGKGMVIS